MLLLNVCLAIAWAAVTGDTSASNILAGFMIGYLILGVIHKPFCKSKYFMKVGQVVRFVLFFVWELVVATLRVAVDIVTPRHRMKPAILAIPIDSRSPGETTMLANAITLTPGTLTLDVSSDGTLLYVHFMYADDVEAARRSIQQGFGRRVHEVFE